MNMAYNYNILDTPEMDRDVKIVIVITTLTLVAVIIYEILKMLTI